MTERKNIIGSERKAVKEFKDNPHLKKMANLDLIQVCQSEG